MKTKTKIVIAAILYGWIVSFSSCSNSSGGPGYGLDESVGFPHTEDDAIMMLSTAFSGLYRKEDIKVMMDSCMTIYKIPLSKEDYLKVGNKLITLRKESKTGICEMDILKSIISAWEEKGGDSFEEQIKLSAKNLENRNI